MGEHISFNDPFMPPGEPIPGKTYRADGWEYFDAPTRFSFDIWEMFLNIIGAGNYVILATSNGRDWVRGQLLISPQGQRNIANWRATPEGKE